MFFLYTSYFFLMKEGTLYIYIEIFNVKMCSVYISLSYSFYNIYVKTLEWKFKIWLIRWDKRVTWNRTLSSSYILLIRIMIRIRKRKTTNFEVENHDGISNRCMYLTESVPLVPKFNNWTKTKLFQGWSNQVHIEVYFEFIHSTCEYMWLSMWFPQLFDNFC